MRSLAIPNSEDAGPTQGGYRPTSNAVPSRVTGEDVCSRMCRLVGATQISGSVSAVLPDCVCTEPGCSSCFRGRLLPYAVFTLLLSPQEDVHASYDCDALVLFRETRVTHLRLRRNG